MISDAFIFVVEPKPDTYGFYQEDAARGHALAPRFDGKVTTSVLFPVKINSHGYRGDEWDLDARPRVMVVGDSFTFGEPLPVEDGFVSKLANSLKDKGVNVMNLGVSGYGTAHILETIRKECRAIQPAFIVYMYYLNDTRWDGIRTDVTTVINGQMVQAIDPRTEHRFTQKELERRLSNRGFSLTGLFLLRHLRPWTALRLKAVMGAQNSGGDDPFAHLKLTNDSMEYPPGNIEIAGRQILSMHEEARMCGAEFAMFILPSHMEAFHGFVEPGTEKLLGRLNGAPFEIINLHGGKTPGAVLYLGYDAHYNVETNNWVAERLLNFFNKRLLKKPPRPPHLSTSPHSGFS